MEVDRSFFVAFSHFLQFFPDLLHSMLCIKIYWHVVYAVELILTVGILREFVMSLKVIIYAKQNGAQMATFAATGTRADIDDLRKTMAALGTRLRRAIIKSKSTGKQETHRHKSRNQWWLCIAYPSP